MLKKFINGLLFGTGFAVAFIVVVVVYFKFFFESTMNSTFEKNESVTSDVPTVSKISNNFLGSTAMYAGGFLNNKSGVLSTGSGKITGLVKSNGIPAKGLRLRLALNGKVMSQWATTNSSGEYEISVPYGEYKIDGYELDSKSANKVLSGLIGSPMSPYSSGLFTVAKGKQGNGINFSFVDPIIKTTSLISYNLNDPVMISWKPYLGAVNYKIQVYEKSSPHGFLGNNTLFSWSERPQTSETSVDLKVYTQNLKSGYYYSYEIRAMGENGQQVSESVRGHQSYDFEVK
ncbi:hypothetical protein MED121_12310 [Marinomonas sp. MED121]|uniref:carboxypeptidase-like regulatory domain-containing protein n=1 Tax=Marinomonas sp. MED121 TaxID=314277 RepID=UPI000068FF62|nr:carboxypeptidase-like regulatory domain-containing protein [Marinomonas sp. MED121]EAQ66708.1 hypothetical protein MED121_12310 [Marinomonas sp. MED121]